MNPREIKLNLAGEQGKLDSWEVDAQLDADDDHQNRGILNKKNNKKNVAQ